MLESAVGASICIALATLDNFTYPADIFPSSRFYADDLGEPAITLTKSAAGVPQAVASSEPGIGAAPNMQRLERLCLKKVVIG
jgi:O-succinylbenzoate synthase